MKLRALIVDDEVHARENLNYLLKHYCPEMDVVAMAGDQAGARLFVDDLKPQVIFLDICMPSGTEGFDFLESLPIKNFQVVFVTAFKDNAIRALHANAIDYLQKPVDIDELRMVVKKIVHTNQLLIENKEQAFLYAKSLENLSCTLSESVGISQITLYNGHNFKIVNPADIMYLESFEKMTSITFSNATTYMDVKPIGIYEDLLDPKYFFRIHKSQIINSLYVKQILKGEELVVIMNDHTKFAISHLRVSRFLEFFNQGKKWG